MDNEANKQDEPSRPEEIAALEIVGVFLTVLGCTMVIAAFWPPTWAGKLTNLLVAALLLGVGTAMFLLGRAARMRHRLKEQESISRRTSSTTNNTDSSET